jgi:hypothetical protein
MKNAIFNMVTIAIMMSSSVIFAEERNPYDLFKKPGEANQAPQTPHLQPQPQPPGWGKLQKLPSVLDCGPEALIKRKLATYKEVEMMKGKSVIQAPHGMIEGDFSFYVNPDSGSFSMVFFLPKIPNNSYKIEACIINVGKELQPGLQGRAI